MIDPVKGYWDGTERDRGAELAGHGTGVSMYSIMENPMTACGCFECIVMYIPEAEGVMVVSREDPSMTPAGMTFSHAGRHGRRWAADTRRDGRRQVLSDQPQVHLGRRRLQAGRLDVQLAQSRPWPTSCRPSPNARATPTCVDKIADETVCTDVDGLLAHLEASGHPSLTMDPIF